ncbi:bis(5'-nucleosyl)-tetraphosphatase (symmetrical) YqeK [Paenibacillus ehimensis]|uniref:Bis(5'-nucleosyl)-tetraphosphatase (Symmetrical) YqeK n=1 Tax=Paenibacillus ehimensis TaxID=79264 RepID=A0ABT8V8E1_9BACL|nr:bis(5'-nucleosyl)-tetraphosphatase (symmetrical) YqeK [Paenibacillus ehimensis]MDO3676983.1 bis(5'-nucleosyl)-tetraphosphatase (symmetrical) YqeK [Paenibacillus ehimensis]
MHPILTERTKPFSRTNRLRDDIRSFLSLNGCEKTAEHCMNVGTEARRIALRFGADPEAAETAGWLHDISAVIPNGDRIAVSRELGIEVLPEEEAFPMIVHQKLSAVMAEQLFGVTDAAILDAVGCHTTLRAGSTLLDQVLFVADKIAWDQPGTPPYIRELQEQLNRSLMHGAFAYIDYLWERKHTLKVVHPWLKEAYEELRHRV